MRSLTDESAFEWIRDSRDELGTHSDPDWKGHFVSHVMPSKFEAYVKVLHRVDAHYENIDTPLSQKEIEILGLPSCDELKSFVKAHRVTASDTRIRWRELADLLRVPFTSEITHAWYRKRLENGCWPRFLWGPADGTLDETEYRAISSVLEAFTGSKTCYFRFAEIPSILTDAPILFEGNLDELPRFLMDRPNAFTPEYWWPADRSWCVCTDYDLVFTIIGGNRELLARLLEHPELECLEVQASSRVDDYAPMP